MDKKEIWPYPSKNDDEPEQASQWKDRVKQVEEAGYVLWRDSKRNQKWEMRDTKGVCDIQYVLIAQKQSSADIDKKSQSDYQIQSESDTDKDKI